MPAQPHLFSGPTGDPPSAPDPHNPGAASKDGHRAAPLWLQRVSLFILVVFCVYLGVIVTVLPWWTAVWDHNLFFTSHPHLWAVLRMGPVRGIISGVGLLDVWIGISEALQYRDRRN